MCYLNLDLNIIRILDEKYSTVKIKNSNPISSLLSNYKKSTKTGC